MGLTQPPARGPVRQLEGARRPVVATCRSRSIRPIHSTFAVPDKIFRKTFTCSIQMINYVEDTKETPVRRCEWKYRGGCFRGALLENAARGKFRKNSRTQPDTFSPFWRITRSDIFRGTDFVSFYFVSQNFLSHSVRTYRKDIGMKIAQNLILEEDGYLTWFRN